MKSEEFEYGYNNGFLDGRVARDFVESGKSVDHGNLLSGTDPYAIGYRRGLEPNSSVIDLTPVMTPDEIAGAEASEKAISRAAATLGRKGGKVKSPRKTAANRLNARKPRRKSGGTP